MNEFVTVEISKELNDAIERLDVIGELDKFWHSGNEKKFWNELNEIKDELGFKWPSQALMYLVATKAYKTKEPKYYLTKTLVINRECKTFYKEAGNNLVTDKKDAMTYTEKDLELLPMFTANYDKKEVK